MVKRIVTLLALGGLAIILIPLIFTNASAAKTALNNPTLPDQPGPPWLDGAWQYRRPVLITNNGAALAYYQVLVKLDNTNFNFSLAKPDGADVRFTHSDGSTELRYWIESWDSTNHLAYVWVRVPGISSGMTVIYVYYDNPAASSLSDGNFTFDSFEENWSQFAGVGLSQESGLPGIQFPGDVYSPFTWSILSGSPQVSYGVLILPDGVGIKSTNSYIYSAMGMRAKFNTGNGYEWGGFINGSTGKRTMIGELPSDASNLYLVDYRSNFETILLPRIGGEDWHGKFHVFEVRWSPNQSRADIDHGSRNVPSTQPAQVPNAYLPVTLYSYSGSGATLLVDWVYIRQYRDPEPGVSVGTQQGLVNLRVSDSDTPDPIQKLKKLTYQITISNTSAIDAPGVILTDSLPASVQLGPIIPSQGSCTPGSLTLCNLSNINANSTAWVTMIVTPTLGGWITNTVSVGSSGYELDIGDNFNEQVTLVDTVPPTITWELPVKNNGTYFSPTRWVTLAATARDNDQVAWVEFKLWDHDPLNISHPHWILLGRDYTYPYQIQFDTNILVPGEEYQTFVYAGDRVGNISDPYDPLTRILLGRVMIPEFLPYIRK